MKLKFNFENTVLSICLAILLPYFSFWSNNSHMFNVDELLFSTFAIIFIAVVIFIILMVVQNFFLKVQFTSIQKRWAFVNFCNLVVCFMFLAFLFKILYPEGVNKYLFFAAVSVVGPLIVFFSKTQKFLNVFLAVLLCFSIVKFSYVMILDHGNSTNLLHAQESSDEVEFVEKPNVYLFILESYHSFDVMENAYGMNVENFENFLHTNDFVNYSNIYSNNTFTLLSVCDLFSMKDYSYLKRGNLDAAVDARLMIGGSDSNIVFKTFKDNGYYVESLWLLNPRYYILQQGKNLDKVDWYFSCELERLLQPVFMINNNLATLVFEFFKSNQQTPLNAAVMASLAAKPVGVPYFLTIKTGADHSPNEYTWTPKDDWKLTGEYQALISNSIAELTPVLSTIIAQDPTAIIILVGDHGSHRLRNFLPSGSISDEGIDKRCAEFGVSRKEIAEDIFGVMLAVRVPGRDNDISNGYVMSHRNLFLHIFSILSQNAALLEKREISVSKDKAMTMVREGEVLPQWITE